MKVLVIGASGQLGKCIYDEVEYIFNMGLLNNEYYFATHDMFDITNMSSMENYIYCHLRPDCIINCAAYTNVEKAEDDIVGAFNVNSKGVNNLVNICNKYGIFIMSATQLNGDYQTSETPDQNLLRGAKAIADKIDFGAIILPVKEDDIDGLARILSNNSFERPDLKISVYKNRRARYKGIYLWCKADLGTCRIIPMFATTYGYEIIQIDNLKILTEEPSAFKNE